MEIENTNKSNLIIEDDHMIINNKYIVEQTLQVHKNMRIVFLVRDKISGQRLALKLFFPSNFNDF